jgi:hypothetical protein
LLEGIHVYPELSVGEKLLAAKSQVARSELWVGMECLAGDVEGLAQVVGGGLLADSGHKRSIASSRWRR